MVVADFAQLGNYMLQILRASAAMEAAYFSLQTEQTNKSAQMAAVYYIIQAIYQCQPLMHHYLVLYFTAFSRRCLRYLGL